MEKRIAKVAEGMGLPLLVDGSTAGIWSKDRPLRVGAVRNARGWAIETMRHISERRLPDRRPLGSEDEALDDRIRRALSPALAMHRRDVHLMAAGIDPEAAPAWTFRAHRAVLEMLDGDDPIRHDLERRFGQGQRTHGGRSFDLVASGGRPRFVLDRDRILLDSWSIDRLFLSEDLRGLTGRLREAHVPDTVAALLKGRRLTQLVSHPRLSRSTVVMISAKVNGDAVEMGYGRAVEPVCRPPAGLGVEWVL